MLSLRPYQLEAVAAVEKADQAGQHRVLVSLPTGVGKTICFAELIRRRPGRALVLAHRDELIEQAVEKIWTVWPEAEIGIVKAERDEVQAPVVVASVQTLSRARRLERLLGAGDAFRTVVVDEAHHATADSYRAVLEALGAFESAGPLVLGVTATAFRADHESLGDIFEVVAHEAGILPMIEAGYLADVRAKQIRLEGADFGFHVERGDYVLREVENELLRADAPKHAAAAYLEHATNRKALLFAPTVAVAYEMARAFRARGVTCEAVDGATPIDQRRAILARFKRGETMVISNCAVLTEGFDEPSISCVIVARPTRSKGLYCQMVGRGTRIFPGKTDLLILDLVGATSRHDLMTAAKLFDVPQRRLEAGESVVEAVAGMRVAAAETAARRVAKDVDPFHRDRHVWIEAAGQYALALGKGRTLFLAPREEERWDVILSTREQGLTVIASALSLAYAQGVAEDEARKANALHLTRKDAPWRSEPASAKQEARLRQWNRWRAGMTRGEASDAITAVIAESAARDLVRS